jgi:hypothetical protein
MRPPAAPLFYTFSDACVRHWYTVPNGRSHTAPLFCVLDLLGSCCPRFDISLVIRAPLYSWFVVQSVGQPLQKTVRSIFQCPWVSFDSFEVPKTALWPVL